MTTGDELVHDGVYIVRWRPILNRPNTVRQETLVFVTETDGYLRFAPVSEHLGSKHIQFPTNALVSATRKDSK